MGLAPEVVAVGRSPTPKANQSSSKKGAAALAATTHVFLASTSASKRRRENPPTPAPEKQQSGHAILDKKWEKVLQMCREALDAFGGESPRVVILNANGPPSPSYIAIQDDAFGNGLQHPATVPGYLRDLVEHRRPFVHAQ